MRALEIVVKWTPVIGPWVNTICFVLIFWSMRRAHKITVEMANNNHEFALGLADNVLALQLEVVRLKALAGMSLEDED